MGFYNGKNIRKLEIFIFGTKAHSYKPIFHLHIEKDQTTPVCLIKNKNYQDFSRKLRLKIFAVTMDLRCNGKSLEFQNNKIFLNQIFSSSSDRLVMFCPTLYVGER